MRPFLQAAIKSSEKGAIWEANVSFLGARSTPGNWRC